MKIVYVCSDKNIGGAGVYLLTLLSSGFLANYDVEIFLPKDAVLRQKLENLGYRPVLIDGLEKSFSFRAIPVFLRKIRKAAPDVVHTHASLTARIITRLFCPKAKIVYTKHTFDEESCNLKKFLTRAASVFFADAVIAVSPAAANQLTQSGVLSSKIKLIYNGVKQPAALNEAQKAAVREKYGISGGAFVFSIIGRLSPEKGHGLLLKAAGFALKDAEKDQTAKKMLFLIVGAGGLESYIRDTILENNLTNVMMLGFTDDVGEILNITDVQINASYREATSLSLLEGLSLAVPAVVSDAGGNPCVIKDGQNGLVFACADARALYEAALKIAGDGALREKLSQGARESYKASFRAEDMCEKTVRLYNNL